MKSGNFIIKHGGSVMKKGILFLLLLLLVRLATQKGDYSDFVTF